MLLLLERCKRKPSASVATASVAAASLATAGGGGAGGWYWPTDRAYAPAASTAVSKEPMKTLLQSTLCFAWKRPERCWNTPL